MSDPKVNIRPSNGKIFQVDFNEATTVLDFKSIIGKEMDIDQSRLKLVFSGRILKDEDTLKDCKIVKGNTVHVVCSGGNKAPAAKLSTATTSSSSENQQPNSDTISNAPSTTTATATPAPSSNSFFNPNPAGLSSLGGNSSSPFGDMQMPNMDPEAMRQMMDSPIMDGIMSNPDFVRSIIMSNPQMKALVEQNPELGHVISDPAFLRQSMEMMRNPELMREMQRNNDRALSNIEAIPGGFNHLRRMYNTVQGPMESAMSPGGPSDSDEANARMARQLNVERIPENSLNTTALPNPWAAPTNTRAANNNNTSSSSSNAATSPAANPFSALFGGSNSGTSESGAAPMSPFGQINQQQPSSQQIPFWADPSFIQFGQRMQQAMAGNNNNSSSNNNNTQQQQQANMFQQMMMGGFGGLQDFQSQSQLQPSQLQSPQLQQQQTSTTTTPSEPPEVRFKSQLEQLKEMGFEEQEKNVRALLATGGNVQAAIEYLFSDSM